MFWLYCVEAACLSDSETNYGNLFQNSCIFSPTSTVLLLVIFKLDIYKVLCAQTPFLCTLQYIFMPHRLQGAG